MPIISPWIFYLISVFNVLKIILTIVSIALGFVVLVLLISLFCELDSHSYNKQFFEECKWINKWFKKIAIGFIVILLLLVVIPSQQTMYTMLVADNVTYENVEIATDTIKDGVDYIFEKLDGDDSD